MDCEDFPTQLFYSYYKDRKLMNSIQAQEIFKGH